MILSVLLAAALAGCAPSPLHSVNGDQVQPPTGYEEYCARNPARAECGGDR